MDEFLKSLPGLGVGGALAALTLYFYREDRNDSRRRYEALAQDFKEVIQENTKAIQGCTDIIGQCTRGKSECP